jgi:hypothetical protein
MPPELYNEDYHMHTDDTIFFGIVHFAQTYGFLEHIGYFYNVDSERRNKIKENLEDNANKNLRSLFNIMKYFFIKSDNNTNEKNNMIKNKNFYRIKNRHCRNNTTYFGQRDIMNILHKKFLSNKNNNNYNMNNLTGNTINNFEKNNINNICINNYKSKNKNIDKLQKFITKNIISKENSKNKSIINKVNYNIIQKEKISRMNKEISERNSIYIN